MNVWTRSAFEIPVQPAAPGELVRPGDYFHTEHDLFRVERCDEGRALIEDCRTGELIDVDLNSLIRLDRVPRS